MTKKVVFWVLIVIFSYTAGFVAAMYLYPSREFSRAWKKTVHDGGLNRWLHRRNLEGDTSALIVRPNHDTLYSSAAVDMDSGPFVIEMPPSDRYWSVEFIMENTDVFTYIGSREYGLNKAVKVILARQDFSGDTRGLPVLKCPGKKAWLLTRFLVDEKADLPRVHQLQDLMKITPLKDYQLNTPE
jgi:hypothetical protein